MAKGIFLKGLIEYPVEDILEVAEYYASKDHRVGSVFEAVDNIQVDKNNESANVYVIGNDKKGLPIDILVSVYSDKGEGLNGTVVEVVPANLG